MKHKVKHVHFVGIGGAGMSGIAEVLVNLGYKVSGSDLTEGAVTRHLQSLGARIQGGQEIIQPQGSSHSTATSTVTVWASPRSITSSASCSFATPARGSGVSGPRS